MRFGVLSIMNIGPPSTLPTHKGTSGIMFSARVNTRDRNESSSNCLPKLERLAFAVTWYLFTRTALKRLPIGQIFAPEKTTWATSKLRILSHWVVRYVTNHTSTLLLPD